MIKTNFLFERKSFKGDFGNAYYEYKGYYIKDMGIKSYPIILYFKKDELVIAYNDKEEGQVRPIFLLCMADGELNQRMLSEKIESYWKMPLWQPKYQGEKGNFLIDKTLLSLSPFSYFYGIDISKNNFQTYRLFKKEKPYKTIKITEQQALFYYILVTEKYKKREYKEIWKWQYKDINVPYINFRRIFIDFIFELNYSNTFEDKNFLNIQPILQNNKIFYALSKKLNYLYELHRLQQGELIHKELPKPFLKAERAWLNICFLENYKEIFISSTSVFDTVENEVKDVLFYARIGSSMRGRQSYLDRNQSDIRNHSASFFLRRYTIWDAFKILLPTWLPRWAVFLIPVLLIIMPLGDFGLHIVFGDNFKVCGIFSIFMPIILLCIIVVYYMAKNINLFKLALPRMFLGIAIGWFAFSACQELWEKALLVPKPIILVTDIVFFIFIFLYLFTEIRNKLERISNNDVLRRTLTITLLAMIMSFIQGFYIIQFFAQPMLETSGIIDKIVTDKTYYSLDSLELFENHKLKNLNKYKNSYYNTYRHSLKHYLALKPFGYFQNYRIRYIWSILFSQFIVSIFVGVILQFLWEDRPITEPL